MRDLVLFEIWGDTRIGLIKSLEINYLKTCQSVPPTPQHRVPHFCSPLWNPFRGCWKSAAAAAYDLILVEVDGKWQWQVPVRSWHLEWGSLTEMCGLGKEKMRGLGWVLIPAWLPVHPLFATALVLQEGGRLLGSKSGLLSNVLKWIIWESTDYWQAKDCMGKWGSRVKGTQEDCSATWLPGSGFMVMRLVSRLSLASHLARPLVRFRVLPGGRRTSEPRWVPAWGFWGDWQDKSSPPSCFGPPEFSQLVFVAAPQKLFYWDFLWWDSSGKQFSSCLAKVGGFGQRFPNGCAGINYSL